jgi:Family of unknown function (DUF6510)
MEPLDGNSIAGELYEFFGTEMTMVTGACAHCGAVAKLAELSVYSKAPGAVARCRSCGNVVMVLVRVRESLQVNLDCLELRDA